MGWVDDKLDSAVDFVTDAGKEAVDFVGDVVDGVGDFVGEIGEAAVDVARSPIGQIAIAVAFPQYAAYINAAAKVANGEDLTAMDFVALGVQGYSDLNAGVEINPEVVKAAETAARIADGADPVQALIGAYGADAIKKLNLDTKLTNTLSEVVSPEVAQFVSEHMDLNQAAADLLAGEQPLRILSNQFGDELVDNLASGDPQLEAIGYAGISTGLALNEGVDPAKAALRGAREYYNRGGAVPTLDDLKEMLPESISSSLDFDISTPQWLKDLRAELPDIDLPKFDASLAGFNWKDLGGSIPDIQLDFPDVELSGLDWQGLDYDVFKDYSLPELQGLGIDLSGLHLPELSLALKYKIEGEDGTGVQLPEDEEEENLMARTTDNPLLAEDDQLPLSRALLQRTATLG